MQEVVLKLRLQGLTKPRCVSYRSFWPQDLYYWAYSLPVPRLWIEQRGLW